MAKVNQEFQSAPMGRRLVASFAFALAMLVCGGATSIFFMFRSMPAKAPFAGKAVVILAPLAGLFVMVPVFIYQRSRIARFRIEENCLVLGRTRYPLEGLVEIARDPEILRWAFRYRGSGGLGSVQGRFWSKRVGTFSAFMTDPRHAVVLRWPDETVAVSPADAEFFIYCARSAAGLSPGRAP
jgi:hypothetical protein